MKRTVIILFALAAAMNAEEVVRKVVEVKHANADWISSLLANYGVNVRSDSRLSAIVVSGEANSVAQAEEAIKKLDVPQPPEKNIELLAYMVLASQDAQSGPEPAELAPAIKQMRSLFPYKSYRLLDTIWVRTRENTSIQSDGLAPAVLKTDPDFNPTYNLHAGSARIVASEPPTVRFDSLALTIILGPTRTKENGSWTPAVKIASSFDVRDGQKVVIGKTNPTGADGAIVLVVTARVVQ